MRNAFYALAAFVIAGGTLAANQDFLRYRSPDFPPMTPSLEILVLALIFITIANGLRR